MPAPPFLSRWVVAVCVVKFDIDEGQVMEFCHPPDVFDDAQARDISYLALPDSNAQKGDCLFTFRIRARRATGLVPAGSPLYGYVYFRQERDVTVRRGCTQSSIVLFSKWPFVNLFKRVVRATAVAFYHLLPKGSGPSSAPAPATGAAALLSPAARPAPTAPLPQDNSVLAGVLEEIAAWPDPELDASYELPLLDRRLKFRVPRCISEALADNHVPSAVMPWLLSPSPPSVSPEEEEVAFPTLLCRCITLPRLCLPLSPLHRSMSSLRSARLRSRSDPSPRSAASRPFPVPAAPIWAANHDTLETLGIIDSDVSKRRAQRQQEEEDSRSAGCSIEDDGDGPATATASPGEGTSPVDLSVSSALSSPVMSPISASGGSSWDTWQMDRVSGRQHLFDDVNVYSCFRFQLRSLWKVWELMVLGRPLLVFTLGPATASECVLSAAAIIAPLSYAGDLRPFFTLQDEDFARFESHGKRGPANLAAVLGITNPYLAKQFSGWKNFISVSRKRLPTGKKGGSGLFSLNRKNSPRDMLDEFREVFITDHKFVLSDDTEEARAMLLSLLPTTEAVDSRLVDTVNNTALRRYFSALTERFLRPLRSCFDELWASVKIPFLLAADYRRLFHPAVFLQRLGPDGFDRALFRSSRQEALAFYRAFVEGPNFALWLKETVHAAFRADIMGPDLFALLSQCSEEQLIEAATTLRRQLDVERQRVVVDRPLVDRLDAALQHVRQTLLPPHIAAALAKDLDGPSPFAPRHHALSL
eukprot:EG_transcript_2885